MNSIYIYIYIYSYIRIYIYIHPRSGGRYIYIYIQIQDRKPPPLEDGLCAWDLGSSVISDEIMDLICTGWILVASFCVCIYVSRLDGTVYVYIHILGSVNAILTALYYTRYTCWMC